MANKIAFINGKGGCGKTTSIFHVSGVLSKAGEKILVVDFDKQRNTTDTLLAYNASMPKKTVLEVMQGTALLEEATAEALFKSRGNANPKYYGVDCLTASINLDDEAKLKKIDVKKFGAALNDFIKERGYTWVLVDMPPSNKELNRICFSCMVDFVIIPFSSDMFSIRGYGDIVNTVDTARKDNPALGVLGVYLSKYMSNCGVDIFIKRQIEKYDTYLDVQIPLAADVREGLLYGRPISYYKVFSESKKAFENLVDIMKKRIRAIDNERK